MRIKTFVLPVLAACAVIGLSACENTKRQLGLERQAPDEFAVVKRAPLEMPPDYSLRPPQPGAPRPQETAPQDQARQAVFGNTSNTAQAPASGEAALLQQVGGAQPGIREVVDQESAAPQNQPVTQRLFGFGRSSEPGTPIDPVAESERLQRQQPETVSDTGLEAE